MRYFYDTEFLEDGNTIELISIGIVSDKGREYYAVNSDMPLSRIKDHDWLVRNVLPSLPIVNKQSLDKYLSSKLYFPAVIEQVELDYSHASVRPQWIIANEVKEFLQPTNDWHDTELWAYYGAYDHIALCQLWGRMIDLPKGIPMFTHELMQEWEKVNRLEKPEHVGKHNALEDARWNRALFYSMI